MKYSSRNDLTGQIKRHYIEYGILNELIDCAESVEFKDSKKLDAVLNLIDEVECGLIKREDALMLANKMVECCMSYPIKRLLEYWISYFIFN